MTNAEKFKSKKAAELEKVQKRYKKEKKIFLAILLAFLLFAIGDIICIIRAYQTKNLNYIIWISLFGFMYGYFYSKFWHYQEKKCDTHSEVDSLRKELNSGCDRKELTSFLEKIFPDNMFIGFGYYIEEDPMAYKKMCVVLYRDKIWATKRKTDIEYLNYWANEIKDTQFDQIKLYIK